MKKTITKTKAKLSVGHNFFGEPMIEVKQKTLDVMICRMLHVLDYCEEAMLHPKLSDRKFVKGEMAELRQDLNDIAKKYIPRR